MTASVQQVTLIERLRHILERGEREAMRRGALLVSTTLPVSPLDPIALFERAGAGERFLWEQPRQGLSMVALGAAERLIGRGRERFSQVATAWRRLVSSALIDGADLSPLTGPVCLGGFAFDPDRDRAPRWQGYPDALLSVPRFLFLSQGGSSWLTVNLMVAPGCDVLDTADAAQKALQPLLREEGDGQEDAPAQSANITVVGEAAAPERWRDAVAVVRREIQRGTVEKVVLAREVRVHSSRRFEPGPVLRRLRSGYEGCTIFAVARGESCFLGATPERLVRLAGEVVQATCLAGSTARGASDEEDRTLGEALLADKKERHEHALVVRALRKALRPLCSQLSLPESPSLLRMPNVQHLQTPVEGVLQSKTDILELVERLHPTPAAAGLPRQAALSLIRAHEPFDRGWYAGPLGWIDGHGGGEFVVAIRSALLQGNAASLYAGCGIVADSDPEREYEESCMKLRSMLWALNNE